MIEIKYNMLPKHMQESTRAYIEHGIKPSGFLYAVLTNNLVEAAMRADHVNQMYLFQWADWLYNECPTVAWKTEENISNWIKQKGMTHYKD